MKLDIIFVWEKGSTLYLDIPGDLWRLGLGCGSMAAF